MQTPKSIVLVVIFLLLGFAAWRMARESGDVRNFVVGSREPEDSGSQTGDVAKPPTFNREIAPILFEHCGECHRAGQAAPFELLTYAQVKRHRTQILEVTRSRFMPPWLPGDGVGEFQDARGLGPAQIALIEQWVLEGAVEGDPRDLPPMPVWKDGWSLGEPDAVYTMSDPYQLGADGQDVYRSFVIPTSESGTRYVWAAEIRPGNPKVVHHAVLQVDRTRSSRSLDARDAEPGFGGIMSLGQAQLPDGHFVGWTPGKRPHAAPRNLAWRLESGDDVVLQLHLRRSGREEAVQASVGFYYTDQPPTAWPYALVLRSKSIDIAPGEPAHRVDASFQLPVDVQVLSVYPHAHYLANRMEAWAMLPDGGRRDLIRIENWDFNWQDEYRYARPLGLPAGTVVSMRYWYDNSADNPRNPNSPPQRVVYGQNSSDEMAELLLQVLPGSDADLQTLRSTAAQRAILDQIAWIEEKLLLSPGDSGLHVQAALQLLRLRQHARAEIHLRRALELEPGSAGVESRLADLLAETGRFTEALAHFEAAERLAPDDPEALQSLSQLLARHPDPSARDPERAVRLALRAAELTSFGDPAVLETVAVAYASAGQGARVIEYSERAIAVAREKRDFKLASQIEGRLNTFRTSGAGEAGRSPANP
ncbi:MAG: tetratricopeptide repeat protein [Verrucomicrobia bacterium]|nr:tetratricopeptide repeat protein [Verrucomicrobiota bacterium]